MPTVDYAVMNGRIVSETRGGSRRYYHADALGSTVGLYNDSQTKTDSFKYWPYGDDRSVSNPTGTKYKFVGVYNSRTLSDNIIVSRMRILDPTGARLIVIDPLWPSTSTYAFAFNNPTALASFSLARIVPANSRQLLAVLSIGRPNPGSAFGGEGSGSLFSSCIGAACAAYGAPNPKDLVVKPIKSLLEEIIKEAAGKQKLLPCSTDDCIKDASKKNPSTLLGRLIRNACSKLDDSNTRTCVAIWGMNDNACEKCCDDYFKKPPLYNWKCRDHCAAGKDKG